MTRPTDVDDWENSCADGACKSRISIFWLNLFIGLQFIILLMVISLCNPLYNIVLVMFIGISAFLNLSI
jgi:hypothetical protein